MMSDPSKAKHQATVHVVVLNYNGGEDTVTCLQSLSRVKDPALAIVVVDNASTDDSVQRIRAAFPDVKLLVGPSNTGYSGGNNIGIRHVLGLGADYVLVMNNDVVVTEDFLRPMVALLERDPSVGVATCKVCYQDAPHRVFAGPGRFNPWICTGMNKGGYIERYLRTDKEQIVDFACGVLFLARREVFEAVGLLDERYFMYFEDVEFSRRVQRKFRIGYTPEGVTYHKSGGGTSIRTYTALYNYYHTRNRLLTFSDEGPAYRSYVVAYSLMNIMLKSLVQLPNVLVSSRAYGDQLRALWKGFRDGVGLMKGAAKRS